MSPGRGREKTEDRQRQAVDAVLELLAEAQIEAVTTRRVARALGISQPALFRHFRSREALLAAVVAQARAELGAVAAAALEAPGGPVAGLERLVGGLLAHVQAHPGLPRLLFGAVVGTQGDLQASLRALVSLQVSLVAELVRQGQAEGSIDPTLAPHAAAAGLVGMLQGLILQWEAGGRAEPLPDQGPSLVALWLNGARARGAGPLAKSEPPGPGPGARGLVSLDVRPILAAGRDPLEDILAALARVAAPGVLELTAPFLPRPLLVLLGRRGLAPQIRRVGALHVVEVPVGGAVADCSALEAPEPMVRVLAAAEGLAPGGFALARVPQVPRPLMAELARRNFTCEVLESPDGTALVRVGRPT
jgi:TetR/AcrR family transcriptional regulator